MPTLSMVDYINFGDFNLDCKWQIDNVIKDSAKGRVRKTKMEI